MMTRALIAALFCLATAVPVAAQNPFSAAVVVNDRAVTYYEIDQRIRFFQLLNAPGDVTGRARDALVDERLQIDAAEALGVLPSEEELLDGMTEFAARVNLGPEEFIQQLERAGVAGETFRDFVRAGIAWRNVVRSQFGPRSQVTEEEVDRALALAQGETGARALLAEIVVPISNENQAGVRNLVNELSDTLDGDIDGFSAAARRYSASQSARQGGSLGWRPLSALPPGLRGIVLALPPGGVSEPVPLGQALAIFQLRDFEESQYVSPEVNAVDYAIVAIPGGRTDSAIAAAQVLEDSLDTCDDLYGVRPDGFVREVQEVAAIPGPIATELGTLDANEVSYDLTTADGALMFLMLCGRTTELPEGYREEIRQQLFNQRLESYAAGYLEELRAEAFIREDG
ncbi:peptidylprolyl isomerase [Rhodobacterales bacterium HKCCE3408]|nr:peptidylprolyl isomerase [Rhodobacterales bacterium HKCCE3408]